MTSRRGEGNSGGQLYCTCALHHVSRAINYCVEKPTYNADHEVIGSVFECKPEHRCTTAADTRAETSTQANQAAASPQSIPLYCGSTQLQETAEGDRAGADAASETNSAAPSVVFSTNFTAASGLASVSSPVPADGAGAASVPPPPASAAARAPLRYYDLLSRAGGADTVRKVCWHCGLSGHEKHDCPNVICRTCHSKRPAHGYHLCSDVEPSRFVFLATALPETPDGMPAVRCVFCNALGHFDCSDGRGDQAQPRAVCSCCYCGEEGHDSEACGQRRRVNPDRWIARMHDGRLSSRGPPGAGSGQTVAHGMSSNYRAGNAFGSTAQPSGRDGERGGFSSSWSSRRGDRFGSTYADSGKERYRNQRGRDDYRRDYRDERSPRARYEGTGEYDSRHRDREGRHASSGYHRGDTGTSGESYNHYNGRGTSPQRSARGSPTLRRDRDWYSGGRSGGRAHGNRRGGGGGYASDDSDKLF